MTPTQNGKQTGSFLAQKCSDSEKLTQVPQWFDSPGTAMQCVHVVPFGIDGRPGITLADFHENGCPRIDGAFDTLAGAAQPQSYDLRVCASPFISRRQSHASLASGTRKRTLETAVKRIVQAGHCIPHRRVDLWSHARRALAISGRTRSDLREPSSIGSQVFSKYPESCFRLLRTFL